jgi:hypothetical protein
MKFPLSGVMIVLFLFSFVLLFSGLLHYWHPNLITLSGIFGNYNSKTYFFFTLTLFGCICGLVYEYTFKDIISLLLYFCIVFPLLMVLWIYEDYTGSIRNKTHIIFALIAFLFLLLYILYNAVKRNDKMLYMLLAIGLFLFVKIIVDVLQYYNSGMTKYPEIVFEEMSLVILFVLAFVRKGDYL